jgi:DNA-binding response OmpR family regulator
MSRRNVLIVEDSADVRNVLAEIITLFGYDVTSESDGLEALEKVKSGNFDLVITDTGLPGMGGDELLREMRLQNIDTPVIVLAAVDIEKGIASLVGLSNYSVIQKPFIIDDLKAEISRFIERGPLSSKAKKRAKK